MIFRVALCISIAALTFSSLGKSALAAPDERWPAAVLLKNFETVFHTTADVREGSVSDVGGELAGQPFGYLIAALDALQPDARRAILENASGVLVGAKGYQAPVGLGAVRSTRCYVILLTQSSRFELIPYFKQVETARTALNAPVWQWQAKLQEFGEEDARPSTLFATQIGHLYVLVANDLQELIKISTELAAKNRDTLRILSTVHDWRQMESHDFWGYRKYGQSTDNPGLRRIAGLGGVGPFAEALSVYIEPQHRRVVLHLFSSKREDPTATTIAKTYSVPSLKRIAPGIWEAEFALPQGASSNGALGVLWLFGWGVVV